MIAQTLVFHQAASFTKLRVTMYDAQPTPNWVNPLALHFLAPTATLALNRHPGQKTFMGEWLNW